MSQMEGNIPPDNRVESHQEPNESAQAFDKLEERSRFALFIAWIALFLTVITIAAGYKNWMQINDRAKQAVVGVSELKQQADTFAKKTSVIAFNTELLADLDQKSQELDHSVQLLDDVKKLTLHVAETVEEQAALLTQQQEQSRASAPTPNSAWRLAELRFLLQIAHQRLHLNQDKDGALLALKSAETTLLRLGSTKYLLVRQKLAEEVVSVEAFLIPNISAISQRIAEFLEVINAMPVDAEIAKQQKITLLPKIAEEKTGFISRMVSGINNAVVIQKFDQSVQKTMGSDEKEKLRNLLQLRFETLRLMVLQGLNYDYHKQLKLIRQMLEKYYPDIIKGSLQQQLDELDKVELSPPPPNISGSLMLLNQLSKSGK
ncbi:MAG: uroporphyrinogen-III C-methyltransferase [Cocleimonas sp.]|nr:uroporphyrinogen-III C-methyltransferase [Cocleimonas sp.]